MLSDKPRKSLTTKTVLFTESQGRVSVANVLASDANQGEFELFSQLDSVVAILQFLHKLSQLGKLPIFIKLN
jgi:hypothetical protein